MIDILGMVTLIFVSVVGATVKARTRRKLSSFDGFGGVYHRGRDDPNNRIGSIG